MTTTEAATLILRSWNATKPVFRRGRVNSKGINEWIQLISIVAAGPSGMLYKDFNRGLNRQRLRRKVEDWHRAGLVVLAHDFNHRNPQNNRPLQRLRPTAKLLKFLRLHVKTKQ